MIRAKSTITMVVMIMSLSLSSDNISIIIIAHMMSESDGAVVVVDLRTGSHVRFLPLHSLSKCDNSLPKIADASYVAIG